ncbi:hypothetical protein K402DRAFT_109487 [Aulographum hederae CBS 113979]|uniref:Uncharacterized protein n=1 Tax=Aulographum hederae CBS 113979 TaxID=1176131 RepID=A0A6G1GXB5_9PEZI|nr:hypothetical protein K402DRAFT_109487 [Aulographum hederae CBS 113979]
MKCNGLEDHNNLWQGCDCFDDSPEDPPAYTAFSPSDLDVAQGILGGLPVYTPSARPSSSSSSSSSTAPSATPSAVDVTKIGCQKDNAPSGPEKLIAGDGEIDVNGLMYRLREVVCNNQCAVPAGISSAAVAIKTSNNGDSCEISVALEGGVEAWIYRMSPSTGDQWQQCWDSTENIINSCIQNGPNTGWWNGNPYQFNQLGLRPLNDAGAQHDPFPASTPPLSGPAEPISWDNLDGSIKCVSSGSIGASDMADCIYTAGSSIIQNQRLDANSQICTNDPDTNCLSHGKNYSPDTGEVLGSWCVIAQRGSCAVVIADKDPHYAGGFIGSSCVSGKDFMDFTRIAANQCGAPAAAVMASREQSVGWPVASWCLTSVDHPEVCSDK